MKPYVIGAVLVAWLAMSPPVYAGVQDWPVVGQVIAVGKCVVGGTGTLLGSLLNHLTAWGGELVQTVGQCALHATDQATDVAEDTVSLTLPLPDAPVSEEAPNGEVPVQ